MSAVEFDNLIFALTESIIEAQSLVEINQIQRLSSRYFDNTGAPTNLNVILPSLQGDEERKYSIPWLSLVPHGSLVIKEANIDFDVDISSITENAEEKEKNINKVIRYRNAIEGFKKELLDLEKDDPIDNILIERIKNLTEKRKFDEDLEPLDLKSFDVKRTHSIAYLKKKLDKYLVNNTEIKTPPRILVDPSSGGIAAKKGSAAKIQIKLASTEISEGMARLLNDVVKAQGYQE